ncbi:MAG TPA: medium chain dehydrogenase/reductase family protein [Thermoleophilaceae bacterium]|jgi:NADPH:quinone reductase-like Zn-dependent oxidoreductase
MRALVITKHGPPEVLKVEERPDPEPKPGEVRVRVRAAGINFADTMARMGLYPDAPKPPCVVGYEFAGEVESMGDGVDSHKPGDRVLGGCRFGAYSELVVTKPDNLLPLPDDWSFEEGAAVPVNYATAYAGIVRYGSLGEGERVLIHAAAGGVGIAATQIAKLVGAGDVYGTASGSKHDAIRGFGVDHPIDYTKTDFVKEVRRIGGSKQPLDLVMDAVGGNSFRKSWSVLGAGGRLVCFGASSAVSGESRSLVTAGKMLVGTPFFNPLKMMPESKAVIGLNMLTLWDAKGSLDEYIGPLTEWMEGGKLRPVVSEAFPLEKGPDAHRFIGERKNVGKVVLTL